MKKSIVIGMAIALLMLIVVAALLGRQPVTVPEETTTVETTTEATTVATEPPITWKTYPAARALTAQQYFVYDTSARTYTTISGSGNERIYPASVTKLFTAYVALQYLEPELVITAGDALTLVAPGSSVAEITQGDQLTVAQLIEAMILPSGNDAAYILAAEAGRVIENNPPLHVSLAVQSFVARMNEIAKEQGMTGTNFVNPDGIHKPDHYTTFDDLVILAELAMQEPAISRYCACSTDNVTFGNGTQKQWVNTNALIDPESEYYCPYAIGLKTGQTPSAGSCLLSAFRYNDTLYIIGVFGCPEIQDRFDDTLQLFNDAAGIQ